MKNSKAKRIVCALLSAAMVISMTACNEKKPSTSNPTSTDSNKPATWIADREIVVRTFDEDIGLGVPEDQINNEVAQKIKELTGITMKIEYTAGPSSREALVTALSAGNLPDAISHYLNDSTRPEFPIVLKAAKEGLFTDLAPYLKESKVYSKYYEKGYLPDDTYNNIIQRPEFNGATYHVHMRINRSEDIKTSDIRGGMYIQKSIVDKLGIKPWEITTSDQLYDLLVKIKQGGFKDAFGKPITPLGPAYWGGGDGKNVRQYVFQQYMLGNQNWELLDGKVIHQIQTDAMMEEINFARKLLSEGLMHKEFFTMDSSRAAEGALSYSFGIIEDTHSGVSDMFDKVDYLPLGPIIDKYGRNYEYKRGKSGYGSWSVPSTTKNPEEIVKFADFLASKEGKLLWQYGIEGKHYDLKDGKPFVKQELLDKAKNDPTLFRNLNIWQGGSGSTWGELFGRTDMDTYGDFGEIDFGENTVPNLNERNNNLVNYGKTERPFDKTVFTTGFQANHYLSEFEKGEQLQPLLDSSAFSSIVVQAIFAKSEKESKGIIDNYRQQLEKAGLNEFEDYLAKICKENPKSVDIRSKAE